jgi:hypothetical protein
MTDFDPEEPPARPRSVIQAIPLQEGTPEDVPDEDVPFQAVRTPAVPSQAVLYRELQEPDADDDDADVDVDADVVTPADDDVVLAPGDADVVTTPADDDVVTTPGDPGGVPAPASAGAVSTPAANDKALLVAGADELRAGWQMIRSGFIDDPRSSVVEAANVVEKAAEMLVAALRAQQDEIRSSWDGDGSGNDTESMRQALLTYQALFNRIAI